jgi:Holliday junction resolvasome RuvABC DNA-binding subunit
MLKYIHYHKSPIGYHIYVRGEKHPVGYLKQIGDKFNIIHNRMTRDQRHDYFTFAAAQKKVSELVNGN